MTKAVVFTIVATAIFVIIIFSPTNTHLRRNRHFIHHHSPIPTFDPLFTDFNTGSNPDTAGGIDRSELNVTARLIFLFPSLDKEPRDGVVSFRELEAWNLKQAKDRLRFLTEKELDSHDENRDGAITLQEYLSKLSDQDIEKNGMEYGEAGWWKEQFDNADVDANGLLNLEELTNFLHPEDSNNPKVQKWLLREKMKRMDDNKDEKLSLTEFVERAYYMYKDYVEFETAGGYVPKPEHKFAELDTNNDGLLELEELKPIQRYLHPGEFSYAKYYTRYLMHEADDNKDGNLTLDEMLNHKYVFYKTVYSDHDENYSDNFYDEL